MTAGSHLTDTQRDAIGYLGGAVLAVCLIPQVAKVIMTRSARDISIIWSLLYTTGLGLSLAYLVLKDAPAAWIPLIFEVVGCLLVLFLKLYYEHTAAGRRYSAAKQHQLKQGLMNLHTPSYTGREVDPTAAAAAAMGMPPSPPASRHGSIAAAVGYAAAAAVASSQDISWRGSAVLGRNQAAPHAGMAPMLDVSVHSVQSGDGSVRGGSRHGGKEDTAMKEQQQEEGLAGSAKGAGVAAGAALEVRCAATSLGSCSNLSGSSIGTSEARQAAPPAVAGLGERQQGQQQQQQQQQDQGQGQQLEPQRSSPEGLFAGGWRLRPVAPLTAVGTARPAGITGSHN